MRAGAVIAVGLVAALAGGARGDEPLRLRANALVTSAPGSDTGLLLLEMDGRERAWLTAEAMVWLGAGTASEADAMVIDVLLRDPRRRGELRVGRFVQIVGALRPVHLDGVAGRARLPWRTALEVFGGIPVQPAFGALAWDWVAGARASRQLGDWGGVGVAILQRRSAGRLDAYEAGLDAGGAPLRWLDLAGRIAWDLIDPGVPAVSDAHASASTRFGAWRVEGFASHVSPSRLLPATSLFSVLGDTPSDQLGASARWRAAPRLDVGATLGVRWLGADAALQARLGATLRLDDRGAGAVALELRRDGFAGDAWTGARATGRIGLPRHLSLATELELVVPDEARGRGAVWPWGLVALGFRPAPAWELAAAIEARASPEEVWRVDGLVRLTRAWGTP